MSICLRRREFIAGIGGAAAGAPAARAQQRAMPVIGVVSGNSAGGTNTFTYFLPAFRQGLKEAGYVEGLRDSM
jgi:hypothetical protein